MDVTVDSRPRGGWAVVRVEGEIDLTTVPRLERAFRTLGEEGHHHIVLDLAEVEFIDSSGLRSLLGTQKRLEEIGGGLLLASVSPIVDRLLEVTGLHRVLPTTRWEDPADSRRDTEDA